MSASFMKGNKMPKKDTLYTVTVYQPNIAPVVFENVEEFKFDDGVLCFTEPHSGQKIWTANMPVEVFEQVDEEEEEEEDDEEDVELVIDK